MQRRRGFTFIELMVVITIVIILVTMAVPMYLKNLQRSRETVLKSDLFAMRVAINRYMYEQHQAPQSLQDLQSRGYLERVPVDPITGTSSTWKTVPEEANATLDSERPGIGYVRSGSEKIALDGTRYADW